MIYWDAPAFRRDLLAIMRARGIKSQAELARRCRLHPSTVQRLARKGHPDLTTVARLLGWSGLSFHHYLRHTTHIGIALQDIGKGEEGWVRLQ